MLAAMGRITCRPALLSNEDSSSHSEPVLSFKGFMKLLCYVSVNSPLMPLACPPRVRLLALLNDIDR
jgi:hypothetical protein